MIIGIGCDIVQHSIAEGLDWVSDSNTMNRCFSRKEQDMFTEIKQLKFLAGRFAAKEAVLKCLGSGIVDGISLCDIEILQRENGKPHINLSGEVKQISDNKGINNWHISITHTFDCSIAYAIAEKDDLLNKRVESKMN